MNPSANEASGGQAPAHSGEAVPMAPETTTNIPKTAEQLPAISAEQASKAVNAAATAMPAMPMPAGNKQARPSTQPTSQGVVPVATDDDDLIEKEWVEKAKAIVEKTRDNPYQQSEELTGVKAEYLRQRYGKTIRVSK